MRRLVIGSGHMELKVGVIGGRNYEDWDGFFFLFFFFKLLCSKCRHLNILPDIVDQLINLRRVIATLWFKGPFFKQKNTKTEWLTKKSTVICSAENRFDYRLQGVDNFSVYCFLYSLSLLFLGSARLWTVFIDVRRLKFVWSNGFFFDGKVAFSRF